MRQKSGPVKEPAEQIVKDIRRMTRRKFSAEEKIRFVLDGLRGEESIAELCRREAIVQNLYYRWSKDFLEAGKKRVAGDTARAATSDEVKDLRREASALKAKEWAAGRGDFRPSGEMCPARHSRAMSLHPVAAAAHSPENVKIVLALVFLAVTVILRWYGSQDPDAQQPKNTT
jgi:transposase